MPNAVILGGPNGAGKTAFASRLFHEQAGRAHFLNADEIGRRLPTGLAAGQRDLAAGRELLRRLDDVVDQAADFVIEMRMPDLQGEWRPLGALSHQAFGYEVELEGLVLALVDVVRGFGTRAQHKAAEQIG